MSLVVYPMLLASTIPAQAIDEDALIAALEQGCIAGARLDLFVHEPDAFAHWVRSRSSLFLSLIHI